MAKDLALTGALVVDGTGARPREDVTIVVSDGRIASVNRPVPLADAEVIDLHGKTLLPADLIVVDGDPLTDLTILTDPRRLCLVLQGGTVTARGGPLMS